MQGIGLFKPSFYQLDQLRFSFNGKEHRSSEVPACQILTLGFSELLCRLREVQNIVDYLESEPKVFTVIVHSRLVFFAGAAEYRRASTTGRYQGSSFVEALVEVLFESDVGVVQILGLGNFSVREIRYNLTDELDNLQVFQVCQVPR